MKLHLKEWSKVLTVIILPPYLTVLVLGIAMVVLLYLSEAYDQCVSALLGLCGYVAAPIGIIYGFYFWAKKAENLVKLAKDMKNCGVSDEVAAGVVTTNQIGGT